MKDLITKNPKCEMLTVENSPVWADIYLINEHNDTRAVIESYNFGVVNTLIYAGWMQNCIVPSVFIMIANALGAKVDIETYRKVVERFIRNHLNGNREQLDKYLPTKDILDKALLTNEHTHSCIHTATELALPKGGVVLTEEELALVFRFGLSNFIFQSTDSAEVTASLLRKVWVQMGLEQRLKILSSPGSIEQLADIGIDVGNDLDLAQELSQLNNLDKEV